MEEKQKTSKKRTKKVKEKKEKKEKVEGEETRAESEQKTEQKTEQKEERKEERSRRSIDNLLSLAKVLTSEPILSVLKNPKELIERIRGREEIKKFETSLKNLISFAKYAVKDKETLKSVLKMVGTMGKETIRRKMEGMKKKKKGD